jgi:hypothetical protein
VAIAKIYGLNENLAACLTANLGTMTEIDVIASAIDLLAEPIGKERVASTVKVLDKIAKHISDARTSVAHGKPMFVVDNYGKEGRYWIRIRARRSLKLTIHGWRPKEWRVNVVTTNNLRRSLKKEIAAIDQALKRDREGALDRIAMSIDVTEFDELKPKNRERFECQD